MSRRPLTVGLVAGVAAAGAMALRHHVPQTFRARWDRTNHAGATVTLLEGPVYAVAAALGGMAAGPSALPVVTVSLGAGAFGALDDLAGDATSKGLRGHLGALTRGEVTTGAVKIVGLAATGLVGAALADRSSSRGALTTLVGGAAVAGAANVANLLDLRPGRALKAVSLTAAPLLLPPSAAGATTAAAALGAAAGTVRTDMRGESMLGDTGANSAGALVGLALVERLGLRGRLVVVAVTAGLTVLSERVSFSAVIEDTPALRRLDRWGRP
ncbi:hypothetical protein ACOCJ4_16330 [Knoellia sp. CPCC 206435]|uniref:hypothetical protein n=1 Tax=Knoellia terrae TaxID=3404797 RepID=UPI003B42A198